MEPNDKRDEFEEFDEEFDEFEEYDEKLDEELKKEFPELFQDKPRNESPRRKEIEDYYPEEEEDAFDRFLRGALSRGAEENRRKYTELDPVRKRIVERIRRGFSEVFGNFGEVFLDYSTSNATGYIVIRTVVPTVSVEEKAKLEALQESLRGSATFDVEALLDGGMEISASVDHVYKGSKR